ncbi:probable ascorbate-specific transmembrane electron transporter 1 [Syzygium oleosum]|uniref:probable ascorbate-specific transmembrane electron transporter 1 n=1 Tax=Syzygium oleosum TaxID=219896 RepID=UPI0011D20F74|nr:probable ascorbate-specific transmembrane electron transporter 1 [Syzygium oleosum]
MAKTRSFQLSAAPATVLAHLLVIAVATLVLVWLLKFQDGVALSSHNKQKIFNLHPLLMVIGFILVGGEAIMVYKTIPAKREVQKTIHMILHLIALLLGSLGVYAVFKFHNELHIPNLYTLHSWLGITTISLFGLQWLAAFFSFVFPKANNYARDSYYPWHIFVGSVVFFLAICTAEAGLAERFIFLKLQHGRQALIMNFTGLLIFLFAVSVGLSVILPRG